MRKASTGKTKGQDRPHNLSLLLSMVAIIVSGLSFWESHQARKLNYESSVPVIAGTVELVEPLTAGKQIQFKVTLENLGKTSAREMFTTLQFKVQQTSIRFEATYEDQVAFKPPVSDLGPGQHTTLYSTNSLSLAHDHDVEAVLSGQFRLYLYGKSTYKDIDGQLHEFHICRFYARFPGTEPLKLTYCDSYNEAT